uniref:Suppressor of white apricot N-terminal domain-containing protein n=1 Tax=Kalanchoe fedtschenkoi TaxID=63787 RepID=A0A7N0T9E1_KALFE
MWHEARKSEKKVHDMMDAARKRAQRRALYLAKRRGDPQQSIQVIGSRCRTYRDEGLYQATEDQQGLIPWNGKEDNLIDRFDGRALLDFIREAGSRHHHGQEKTEEEEELEEFVNFERYRDLIKHRRRGFNDADGLQHVNQAMEAKTMPFAADRSQAQPATSKGSYSQVGFSYEGDGKDDPNISDNEDDDEDDEDEEEEYNSDDSNDEGMDTIAKDFGVKRFGWLVYMDKKAKEEEKRQKEAIKGDPAVRKLSRKERRKASQIERERGKDYSRYSGPRVLHHDPYREQRRSPTYDAYPRSRRSRSRSPSNSRRHGRGPSDDHQSQPRAPKVEFITEFGGSADVDEPKLGGFSPPSSPPSRVNMLSRPSSGCILEALHVDPASGITLDKDRNTKIVKPPTSSSSALAKLSKTAASGTSSKQGEKKETPQERLKRIMSKQLNKQIKKDTAAEMAKKREQEKQRLEKLAETERLSRRRHRSRSRSYSPSPPRSRSRSRSHSRSSRRRYSRSRSVSRSPRSRSSSRSPRPRSRSRY